LSLYLQNLPETIPYADPSIPQYGFDFFTLDDEKIQDYGPIGAVNHELEVRMGQRNKGPISFKERGPSLNAVTNVLGGYLDQYHESPETVLLVKWVDDLTIAAAAAFKSASIPVSSFLLYLGVTNNLPTIQLPFESRTMAAKPKESVVHQPIQPLSNSIDQRYIDLPEVADLRTSGAKIHPLLLEGTRRCYKVREGEVWKEVRCIGSKKCGTTWNAPRSRDRIMGHLAKCSHIDEKFHDRATEFLAGVAKGPKLSIPDVTVEQSNAKDSDDGEVMVMTHHGSDDQKKTADKSVKSFSPFISKGKQDLKERVDHAVMKFIVCCGVPPTVVDSEEWKQLLLALNPNYHTTSSTALTKSLILKEAAKISEGIKDYLHMARHLTITFDGGKVRRPRSLYTIHITVPGGRTFCMELNDADICLLPEFAEVIRQVRGVLSFMSHSTFAAEHFEHQRALLNIGRGLEGIGDTRFGTLYWAALSVQRGIPAFQAIIEDESLGIEIRGNLNELFVPGGPRYRFEMDLSKFLSVVGPWARGLKCLEGAQITADHVYFVFLGIMSQHEEEFRENKHRLLNSTMESTRQIGNGRFDELINETPQSHDLYVTTFVLNPVYRNAPIYKQVNPMAGPTLTITKSVTGVITCATKPPQDMVSRAALALQRILRREYGDSYEVGKYPDPVGEMKLRNPMLAEFSPMDALASFRTQFKAYIKGEDPFNRKMRTNESALGWWKALQRDELANVLAPLAIKAFSVSPTSMPDERTM
ncbi:uncharacterized protein F5891DRAFT_896508, partial [Suillus fuscotomentosus]